ncbi:DUF1697 domain-containing protein [Sphingomonas sp. Y38-1Y]|uniref:DUF1697 domain-containing protein n=1 Tax=Sphingomonas sp. Y38-1Y TaxID=3078265 RepID=UPI0028EE41A3|nr:DUF1697 domain-containing protein [Sphingomonas sp. Y38-1Y]
MTAYVGLLRAVNVGGTGKLAMTDLKRLCEDAGFANVRTYIASGNVVFESDLGADAVKQRIEDALAAHAGRAIPVAIRTAEEMAAVLRDNPFSDAPKNRTVAVFLDEAPAPEALDGVVAPDGEKVALGAREIYIAYGDAMARSKLKVPAAERGTARNMNTVAKLAAMAAGG